MARNFVSGVMGFEARFVAITVRKLPCIQIYCVDILHFQMYTLYI